MRGRSSYYDPEPQRCGVCDRRCRNSDALRQCERSHELPTVWTIERLEASAIPEPNSGCLLWLGSCTTLGYPNIRLREGEWDYAYRRMYELAIGPIPGGLRVHRRCEVLTCIAPQHLVLRTVTESLAIAKDAGRLGGPAHSARMMERAARGEKHGFAKLTDSDVRSIRSDDRLHRQIAESFGVSQSTISRIKSGHKWRHVQ